MNFISSGFLKSWTPERYAKWTVLVACVGLLLWIAESNIAFFGTHRIKVGNFINLPPAVQLVAKSQFTNFSDGRGQAARPNQNSSLFRFTLPRGFATASTELHYTADPEQTVILSAMSRPGEEPIRQAYRHPDAIPPQYKGFEVSGGRVYFRNPPETADYLWQKVTKAKNIVAIGPNVLQLLQPLVEPVKPTSLTIPFNLRSSFTFNTFLPAGEQQVHFTKRDLNFVTGDDTFVFRVRNLTNEIMRQLLPDDGNISGKTKAQDFSITLNVPQAGFYDFIFTSNNDDSTIETLRFTGSEVALSGVAFFAARQKPVTFFSECTEVEVEAVKTAGFQTVTFGSSSKSVQTPKESVSLSAEKSGLQPLVMPRGDIVVRSACPLLLSTDQTSRKALNALRKKITLLQDVQREKILEADVVLDSYALPTIQGDRLRAVATFPLARLAAEGRSFVFEISLPGYMTRSEAEIRLLDFTLIVERPHLRLKDITDFLRRR